MAAFDMEIFMRLLKKDKGVRALIPMEMKACAPTFCAKNGKVFLNVPFAKYKETGKPDGTLVYPIAFVVTFEALALPEMPESFAKVVKTKKEVFPGKIVAFRTLKYEADCADVDFGKPIGTFRHEAIRGMSKDAYIDEVKALYDVYGKLIGALLSGEECALSDRMTLKQLLGELVVPGQKQMYSAVDKAFFDAYLA